jgi:hypothetical protein
LVICCNNIARSLKKSVESPIIVNNGEKNGDFRKRGRSFAWLQTKDFESLSAPDQRHCPLWLESDWSGRKAL